jgi:hypothetical protein
LKEWHEVEERCKQATADKQHLTLDCERLREEIREYQFWYAVHLTPIHPNMDLAQMSTHQLDTLNQALVEDQQAGKATWALYETQKKMVDACNTCERFIAFRTEHFVLDEAEKRDIQRRKRVLAANHRYIRRLGPQVVKERERVMWEEENDSEDWD